MLDEFDVDKKSVNKTIKKLIMQIADEQSIEIVSLSDRDHFVEDLGFSSLDIATLVALLEVEFKIDPFSTNKTVITEISRIEELVDIYYKCLSGKESVSSSNSPCTKNSRGQARREAYGLQQQMNK
jgi:acyl carrier protein